MKKIILTIGLMGVLAAGCGQNPAEKEFKGVEAKHDYIADGMKYLSEADIPKAIQSFDRAIKQDPQNVDNYIILAQVYMRLNQFPRAVDTLSAAVRVDPNNGDAYYLLATSRALDGQIKEAVEAAQRSIEIYMQNKDEEKFKRGVALLKSLTEGNVPPPAPAAAATP